MLKKFITISIFLFVFVSTTAVSAEVSNFILEAVPGESDADQQQLRARLQPRSLPKADKKNVLSSQEEKIIEEAQAQFDAEKNSLDPTLDNKASATAENPLLNDHEQKQSDHQLQDKSIADAGNPGIHEDKNTQKQEYSANTGRETERQDNTQANTQANTSEPFFNQPASSAN